MAVDLRHLRCFVAVAEELHFHRAAKKLGVAQPALSRTIKNLESTLGFALFERSKRRVELSAAGQTFLKGSREILLKTQRVIEDAQRTHQGKTGTLRIGYTENAMAGIAPRLLKTFQDQRPDIAMHLQHAVTSRQLKMLDEGTLDFGFATDTGAAAGANTMRIQSERFVCVVYEGHSLAARTSVTLRDLANEPMIQGVEAQWEHFYSYLTPLYRKAGFEPHVAQEGLTTSDIQRLVACGIGIAVLTETVAETLAPGLKVIPIIDVTARLDTIVVWKSDTQNSSADHFIAFLTEAFHEVV